MHAAAPHICVDSRRAHRALAAYASVRACRACVVKSLAQTTGATEVAEFLETNLAKTHGGCSISPPRSGAFMYPAVSLTPRNARARRPVAAATCSALPCRPPGTGSARGRVSTLTKLRRDTARSTWGTANASPRCHLDPTSRTTHAKRPLAASRDAVWRLAVESIPLPPLFDPSRSAADSRRELPLADVICDDRRQALPALRHLQLGLSPFEFAI